MYDETMPELKDCPFCGCLASLKHHGSIFAGGASGYRIECEGTCHSMTCYWHIKDEAIKAWNSRADRPDPELTTADYEEVLADHRRLVRELDVALNGEGSAKQASLCDIVAQVKNGRWKMVKPDELKPEIEKLRPPSEYTHGFTSGYNSGKWDAYDAIAVLLDAPERQKLVPKDLLQEILDSVIEWRETNANPGKLSDMANRLMISYSSIIKYLLEKELNAYTQKQADQE